MRLVFFSTKPYEKPYFEAANAAFSHEILFLEEHISVEAIASVQPGDAVCCFVSDGLDKVMVDALAQQGCALVALRSAGFNHVDIAAAKAVHLPVVRVPAYSPYAVAEHTVGLLLSLNRHLHRAYNRTRDHDFSLHGFLGFDCYGKTVGVIGLGSVGSVFAHIMRGFGCRVLGTDPHVSAENVPGIEHVDLPTLLKSSDIVSLHCPLNPTTHHLIDAERISIMKPGAMLLNTSRGAVIDTPAVLEALKSGQIGHLGIDVYEEEDGIFFEDVSDRILQDDCLSRLMTFPNVLITAHQAFFTKEAMHNIAETTLQNLTDFSEKNTLSNAIW